eukprot:SAG22_NODE_231_length_14551_cov_22.298090_8_plen_217_part_00
MDHAQRINSAEYDKTWWEAHWPKVAALGLFLLVLVVIIVGIAAGSSSKAGTVLAPPPPPPVPPPPPERVAPPVEIGYSFQVRARPLRAWDVLTYGMCASALTRLFPPVWVLDFPHILSLQFPAGSTSAQVKTALTAYLGLSPPAAVTALVSACRPQLAATAAIIIIYRSGLNNFYYSDRYGLLLTAAERTDTTCCRWHRRPARCSGRRPSRPRTSR